MAYEFAFDTCNCPRTHISDRAFARCALKAESFSVENVTVTGQGDDHGFSYGFMHTFDTGKRELVDIQLYPTYEKAHEEVMRHEGYRPKNGPGGCSGTCTGHILAIFDRPGA